MRRLFVMMPVRKTSSPENSNQLGLRVAGLIVRRSPEREFHTYLPLVPYDPRDYQILLRTWPSAPFKGYLRTFSGSALGGQDPPATLVRETQNWTRRLAEGAALGEDSVGVSVRRSEFLSVHGGGRRVVDPVSGNQLEVGVILCYVLPTTVRESSVVSRYPATPDYPQFYDLGAALRGMMPSGTLNIHPFTREMLSALDKWLRERHALTGAINHLFSPSLESRLKLCISNPLHCAMISHENEEEDEEEEEEEEGGNKSVHTPNVTVTDPSPRPISISTPFQHRLGSHTSPERTVLSLTKANDAVVRLDQQPADVAVKNPLFCSGLQFNKVDMMVVNQYFGAGVPDYDSLGEKRGKWSVQVEGDGMADWMDLFPMHKCACEGDREGVRRCVKMGVPSDEQDTDSWTALHYACWYGELEVVKVLVEEASANLGIQNNSDSTPLHLAAATGRSDVVAYLLQQPGMHLVQTAIDCEGKSPLAVCLECRQNNWSESVRLLREAYKKTTHSSPHHISHSSPSRDLRDLSPSPVPFQNGIESLSERGSQGNLSGEVVTVETPREKLVRRQRVDFQNGQHLLAHFRDGKDTPTSHILQDIYKLIHLAPQYHNMLALWIQSDSLEIQLGDSEKPLLLMSSWQSLLTRHVGSKTSEIPRLFVRRNVFISPAIEKSVTDATVLKLLYADAKKHVLSGQYPCTEEEAIELGGLEMQVSYGDHVPMVHHNGFLRGQLEQVLPVAMATSRRQVEFERRVLTQHSKISSDFPQSDDLQACYHKRYLQKCWQWPFYGAAFFRGSLATKSCRLPTQVKVGHKVYIPVSIGISTFGFHIISMETKALLISLNYDSVEWDASTEKHRVHLSRSDKSLHMDIKTRKAGLLYSLVSQMTEQYLSDSHSTTPTTN